MTKRDLGCPHDFTADVVVDTIKGIVDGLAYMDKALRDDYVRNSMLRDLGATAPPNSDGSNWSPRADDLEGIDAYRESVDVDAARLTEFVQDGFALYDNWFNAIDLLVGGGPTAASIANGIFDLASSNFIRHRYPAAYWSLQPFAFLSSSISEHARAPVYGPVGDSGRLRALRDLVTSSDDNVGTLSLVTLFPVAITGAFLSGGLFSRIPAFAQPENELRPSVLLGIDLPLDYDDDGTAIPSPTPLADDILRRTLSFALHGSTDPTKVEGFDASMVATLVWVPRAHGGTGLYVGLGGAKIVHGRLGDRWKWTFERGLDAAVAFIIPLDLPEDISASTFRMFGPENGRAKLTLEAIDSEGDEDAASFDDRIDFPSATGTHFEFSRFALTAEMSSQRVGALLETRNAALIIDQGDADGVIAKVMPSGLTRIDFALGIGLDTERGLYLEGGSGLSAVIPIGKTLGPIAIQTITVALGELPDPESGTRFELSAGLRFKLRGFTLTLDRIGMTVDWQSPRPEPEPPEPRAPALDFGLKLPNGIGLSLSVGSFVGGGYLYLDPDNDRYAGAFHLEAGGLAFKAIGLLTTALPDDPGGYSLLLIGSAEFGKSGAGFRLIGAGIIVGHNRGTNIEALRSGLRNGNLDSVLFPEDPMGDAPRLISNLRQIFPATADQMMVGITAALEWGARQVITVDIGVVFEWDTPSRLLLLGQFKVRFPQRNENALVRVNIDFVGDINFDVGTVAFDAVLRDSRLFRKFVLTGDAALRWRYRGEPEFTLSLGGFHPDFDPPDRFPVLTPLAVEWAKTKNFRARLSMYLAVTCASVQGGAHLELFVKAGGFSVEGSLRFDLLYDWTTCEFTADFGGGVTVKFKGRTLFGVHLDVHLTGASDMRCSGKAKLKIWRFSYTKRFCKPIASERSLDAPLVDPLTELLGALRDANNWADDLSTTRGGVVTVRAAAGQGTLINPLASLLVRQNVVPLNRDITLFAGATPPNDKRFTIDELTIGVEPTDSTAVTDFFAAAQFLQMSDGERLTRPGFELMDSGLRVSADAVSFGGQANAAHMVQLTVEHETNLVDEQNQPRPHLELVFAAADFALFMATTAVGRSPVRSTTEERFPAPASVIARARAAEGRFVITTRDDLSPVEDGGGRGLRYSEAVEALEQRRTRDPVAGARLQIMREQELLTASDSG